MEFSLPLTDRHVAVRVILKPNTRRMSLRVRDGIVTVSAPTGQRAKSIQQFVSDHTPWIEKHLARALPPMILSEGLILPILGMDRTVTLPAGTKGPRVELTETHLICRSPTPELSIPRFLRAVGHAPMEKQARTFATHLGLEFNTLTLKDTRSRWGSCSHQGNLNLHWKLIFAPVEVMDYVIAHEVCHLKEFNHSPAFWALVSTLCPGYLKHRQWLKSHGPGLHGYFMESTY